MQYTRSEFKDKVQLALTNFYTEWEEFQIIWENNAWLFFDFHSSVCDNPGFMYDLFETMEDAYEWENEIEDLWWMVTDLRFDDMNDEFDEDVEVTDEMIEEQADYVCDCCEFIS